MTPSKLRRQGREAFDPNSDPSDFCPYGALTSPSNYGNWMEGWCGEEKAYKKQQKEADENEALHDEIMAEIESLQRSSSVSGLVKLLINRGILSW